MPAMHIGVLFGKYRELLHTQYLAFRLKQCPEGRPTDSTHAAVTMSLPLRRQ